MAAGTVPYAFRFDAGRVCLDLTATGPYPAERLDGPERLRTWLLGAGLLLPGCREAGGTGGTHGIGGTDHANGTDAGQQANGAGVLDIDHTWVLRFRELRDRVTALVRAQLTPGQNADSAMERVNTLAAAPLPALRAVRQGDVLVRTLTGRPGCEAFLAVVARDAVELLTDPSARSRLRQCEGDNCTRVYLDTSRGRRRRWCSSELCGNRERVARHRRRAVAAGS
ncbi:ABATE domain-containing protein [Streptomyces sp. GC420]|uniref:CGNR zinc finger domain-containing protein n=1 Tax=Streptomyces sp. GC420 TaxID=2697568 RepID=UPI001414CDE3|nr:CGNR zinc finger domain-containing protein [Streptomyces sp. GC420]NBM18184.1 hypothetical protein [Streptomyces sp. GC420]